MAKSYFVLATKDRLSMHKIFERLFQYMEGIWNISDSRSFISSISREENLFFKYNIGDDDDELLWWYD